jgi:hypothetical protein
LQRKEGKGKERRERKGGGREEKRVKQITKFVPFVQLRKIQFGKIIHNEMSTALFKCRPNLKFQTKQNQKPKTKNQKPKTKNQKPKTKNQKPKTQNQKPKTKNQKPKTKNQKPKAKKSNAF